MQQWLLVFDSTHHAIAAEKWIKTEAQPHTSFQLIPTPRQITASCGVSLLFSGDTPREAILERLTYHEIQWAGLYSRESQGHPSWHQEVEGRPARQETGD